MFGSWMTAGTTVHDVAVLTGYSCQPVHYLEN
jgi:hypothetical protein